MDSLGRYLTSQALNNAWANHRLLAACEQLSAPEFEARRTGFFPSIKATLNHILTVDWYYVDAIERSLAGRAPNAEFTKFFEPEEPYAECAALRAAQAECDRRLLAICERLDEALLEATVEVPRQTRIDREALPRLLAHLFQHQVHHRGQVHAMLAGTHIAPPQLDEFFCAGDAPLRAADLAAMGLPEGVVWPDASDPAKCAPAAAPNAAGHATECRPE